MPPLRKSPRVWIKGEMASSWRDSSMKPGPSQPHSSNTLFIRKQGEKSLPSPVKLLPSASRAAELAQIR